MVLVGAAFQTGALPLPADADRAGDQAERRAVAPNLQAFRRGPAGVADPARSRPRGRRAGAAGGRPACRPPPERAADARRRRAGSELAAGCVASRVPDLVAYQDEGTRGGTREFVARVRAAERARRRGHGADRGGRQVPVQADGVQGRVRGRAALARPASQGGGTGRVRPGRQGLLPAAPAAAAGAGPAAKITLGPWFRPAFGVLRTMQPLRGTPATSSATPGCGGPNAS